MKNSLFLYYTFILILITSCNKTNEIIYADIKYQKEIDFGIINLKDTVTKSFKIKNISSIPLVIKNVKTSCGCTLVKLNDTVIGENESTNITAKYIPNHNDKGKISKSIVVQANTKTGFTVLYLKGIVK